MIAMSANTRPPTLPTFDDGSSVADSMSRLNLDRRTQDDGSSVGGDPAATYNVPVSPVRVRVPSHQIIEPSRGVIESGSVHSGSTSSVQNGAAKQQRPNGHTRQNSSVRLISNPSTVNSDFASFNFGLEPPLAPFTTSASSISHGRTNSEPAISAATAAQPQIDSAFRSANSSTPSIEIEESRDSTQGLPYFHQRKATPDRVVTQRASQTTIATLTSTSSDSQTNSSHDDPGIANARLRPHPRTSIARPASAYTLGSELHPRGRSLTPHNLRAEQSLSPLPYARNVSVGSNGRSVERPGSYVDLNNVGYTQQMAQQTLSAGNAQLRSVIGANASLLDTKKTIDLYKANAKKINDMATQYEFAIFMVNAAQEAARVNGTDAVRATAKTSKDAEAKSDLTRAEAQGELLKEAKQILLKLADRGYQYAQYYLADGYASGVFNKGKPDNDKALPLFLAAGKHGHAEAAYRTALCYEFGWGTKVEYLKAQNFLQIAAAKGHPGAATRLGKACLFGDIGFNPKNSQREGVRWLTRATEAADVQHNSGPYELGLLHMNGYKDFVLKDQAYAARLFTQAAELGHGEANLAMGRAYEHELMGCPKDAALSIHFYTGAAQAGVAEGMMALCAWYLVGAEPVLERNESEAFEWALKAAQTGYPVAEYAVGYFTEMGTGCHRDPLEANVWYVKAAEHGERRAAQRLQIIREASTFESTGERSKPNNVLKKKKSNWNIFK